MTISRFEPTARQWAVLAFVARFVEARGYCPTLAEIAAGLGLAGKTGPVCHLQALRRGGAIEWAEGCQRTVRPTAAGWHLASREGRPAGVRPSAPAGRSVRHACVTVRRDGVKRKARTVRAR